jgi:hypothetical protein
MKYTKYISLAILAVLSTYNSSIGQTEEEIKKGQFLNTITTAVPFLMIGPDSRAGAMGDVGAATKPDANSAYWNTAKTAFIEQEQALTISYIPWLRNLVSDIYMAQVGYTWKPNERLSVSHGLRYFSLGEITFRGIDANLLQKVNPNELAIDLCGVGYKLNDFFSGGFSTRYIYSNLTSGASINGSDSKAGNAIAVDINGFYKKPVKVGDNSADFMFGFNIQNIGNKVSYSESAERDFIPMNLKLGTGINIEIDEFNEFGLYVDINKLLVPTPPVYKTEGGGFAKDANDNYIIESGKDPNVSTMQGLVQSFYDAPGGMNEEFNEINWSLGAEYWYDQQFALRMGYFYENPNKGNRNHMTLGLGLKYQIFNLDFSYLVPFTQRNPLENTLRITMSFDFADIKSLAETN